jgi:hypothetical protein
MIERSVEWYPLPDIADGFGTIGFEKGSFKEARRLRVLMHGGRVLSLNFVNVIALRFEDECPGYDQIPKPWPMLREKVTFPLLTVEGSSWRQRWMMHKDLTHYVLISSEDLVQVLASPKVDAQWQH